MSTKEIIFTARLSEFHGSLAVGDYRTLFAAAQAGACRPAYCSCGGGSIEVEGRGVELNRLPMDVLAGRREATAEEVRAALR